MNKKIKALLALIMSMSMAMSVAACGFLEPETSEESNVNNSEVVSEETSEEASEETSEEVSEETSEETSEEVIHDGMAKVTIASADDLVAWNAEGITLYDLTNFQPVGTTVELETAYTFYVTETLEEAKAGEYANWIADYYVSVDTALEAGKIGLAGAYEEWDNGAWVAFYSPIAVEANQKIGLLESTGKKPWTYAEIVEFVGVFRCGAFDLDNACSGVTLTVELRLTNPDNAEDCFVVNSTTYTFA